MDQLTGVWWIAVGFRSGQTDVLMARSWPAARRVRDEAMERFGEASDDDSAVVQVGVYDDLGGCVFDAHRDWVPAPMSWSMVQPKAQGRYDWSEASDTFVHTGQAPASAALVAEAGDWRSTSKWFDGKKSCPECGALGWRQAPLPGSGQHVG